MIKHILFFLVLISLAYANDAVAPVPVEEPEYQSTKNYNPNVPYGAYYKDQPIKPVAPTVTEEQQRIEAERAKQSLDKKWYIKMGYKAESKQKLNIKTSSNNNVNFAFNETKTDTASGGEELAKGNWVGMAGSALDFDSSMGYYGDGTFNPNAGPQCKSTTCAESLGVAVDGQSLTGDFGGGGLVFGVGYNFNSWLRADVSFKPSFINSNITGNNYATSGESTYSATTDYMCSNFGQKPTAGDLTKCDTSLVYPDAGTGIGRFTVEQTDKYNLTYSAPDISVRGGSEIDFQLYADYKFNTKYESGVYVNGGFSYQNININVGNATVKFEDKFSGTIIGLPEPGTPAIDNDGKDSKYSGTYTQNFYLEGGSETIHQIKPLFGVGYFVKLSPNVVFDVQYGASFSPAINYSTQLTAREGMAESSSKYEAKEDEKGSNGSAPLNGWNTKNSADGGTISLSDTQNFNIDIPSYFSQSLLISVRFYLY